jgi:transposase
VVDNETFRKTFRPKREEVTGKRRKLHIEAFHNLYSSQDIAWVITKDEMSRQYGTHRGET